MNLAAILILSMLAFTGFISFVLTDEKHNNVKVCILVLTAMLLVGNSILIVETASKLKDIPTAMDVYQGKTTLEYTVVDSVITDSTVVFKTDVK